VNAVEIRNVTKRFDGHTAVDDLSLDVPEGCVYGFIGPNGSGKTTTLRMILNIFYPDSGSIQVFGGERHEMYTDRIGYLPEERGLYKKMKVRPLLRFYGQLKNGKNVNKEVDQWLERFDLAEWADKRIETLSKGMAQKVQFISAVVSRPEMLILDEPFTGLDPVNTDVLEDAVLDIQKTGTTIIFSTHDMDTAEKMCDFIFMIFKGRKVLDGTLAEIQDMYGTDTVRVRFDGDVSLLDGIAGIERIRDFGHMQELRLAEAGDSQRILAAIMAKAQVSQFELTKPSLHDIFVRIAGPEAQKAAEGHA
jgi:ABC-2 type transport system ATP-binding protein